MRLPQSTNAMEVVYGLSQVLWTLHTNVGDAWFLRAPFIYRMNGHTDLDGGNGLRVVVLEATTNGLQTRHSLQAFLSWAQSMISCQNLATVILFPMKTYRAPKSGSPLSNNKIKLVTPNVKLFIAAAFILVSGQSSRYINMSAR